MNENLAVEVEGLPVRVVMRDGGAMAVEVFLHKVSRRHFGAETLGERLSQSEGRFLPCQVAGGVELVNLDHVAYFECPADLPEVAELDELSSFRVFAVLELVDGERLAGELRYRLPATGCRISDLLNADERFLLLTQVGRCYYVSRAAVVRLREQPRLLAQQPSPPVAEELGPWDPVNLDELLDDLALDSLQPGARLCH